MESHALLSTLGPVDDYFGVEHIDKALGSYLLVLTTTSGIHNEELINLQQRII